jgi:S1-C subfamily serine protease
MKKILIIFIILISASSWAIASIFMWQKNINTNTVWIKSLENNITSLVKKVSPSVVSIVIKKDINIFRQDPWGFFQYRIWSVEKKVWGWTGFFISKDWIIITNKHVIADKTAKYSIILNNWKEYDAEIIAIKKNKDIAFLKLLSTDGFNHMNFTPLKFIEKKENLKLWQFAIAIWNALAEFQNSVSIWVVSGINRKIEDNYNTISNLIQTDAAINPWNSWWPLLNLNWKVMWINTMIINWSQNIWFAISLNQEDINNFLKKIKTK